MWMTPDGPRCSIEPFQPLRPAIIIGPFGSPFSVRIVFVIPFCIRCFFLIWRRRKEGGEGGGDEE
eukprot:4607528-Pyramimonas_sp.AAC.1